MYSTRDRVSPRFRLVFWSTLSAATVTCIAGLLVCIVSHVYLYGSNTATMRRLVDDLSQEYGEYGGWGDRFRDCIDEDVAEHDAKTTNISVLCSDGTVIYSTPELQRKHHEFRRINAVLPDGNVIEIVKDTQDIRRFMRFLYALFVVLFVIMSSGAGISAYVIGGRILSLNELIREKDAAYAELRSLTDDIAHDLRTPLTRLAMAAESAMLDGSLERLPANVARDSRSMLEMVNTMLDISQTNARINRTPREIVDVAEIVRTAGELYRPVAEDSGLRLSVEVSEGQIPFSGHRARLQQVIANLLENAVKFTPRGGGIRLRVQSENDRIEISVSDSGAGIAPEDVPHVFKRFWRADSSRHLPGNGLGLALVHAIVTSYGGSITCDSRIGTGTTFTVVLPSDMV